MPLLLLLLLLLFVLKGPASSGHKCRQFATRDLEGAVIKGKTRNANAHSIYCKKNLFNKQQRRRLFPRRLADCPLRPEKKRGFCFLRTKNISGDSTPGMIVMCWHDQRQCAQSAFGSFIRLCSTPTHCVRLLRCPTRECQKGFLSLNNHSQGSRAYPTCHQTLKRPWVDGRAGINYFSSLLKHLCFFS